MWAITLKMEINRNAHTCVCKHKLKMKNIHKRNKEKGEVYYDKLFCNKWTGHLFFILGTRLYWYGKYSVPNVFIIQSYFEIQYGILLHVFATIHMKRNTSIQKGIQRDREREERVLHSQKLLYVKISVNNVLNNEKMSFLYKIWQYESM